MSEGDVSGSVESQFARRLASNEKKTRDRALKKLKRYMSLRSHNGADGFSREEMLRIWKGLFYCMWMSDKPLIQEELSKTMSNLMLELHSTKTAMMFFDVFLQTMLREWMGIDRLRMDKFYLLVRNVLQASFMFLKSKDWDVGIVDWLLAILKNGPLSPVQPYSGMHYHLCDIYLEELAKVGASTMSSDLVMKFLDPYCIFITKARNNDLVSLAITEIFEQLIENSKPALDLLAEEENNALVQIRSHTQLPASDASPIAQLMVDYNVLANRIFGLGSEENVLSKNKKKAFVLVGKFRELAEGRLPLDDIPDAQYSSEDELETMECSLVDKIMKQDSDEFRMNHQSKKTRKTKDPMDKSFNEDENISVKLVTKDKDSQKNNESTVKHRAITKKNIFVPSALRKRKRKKSLDLKRKLLESSIEDSSTQCQADAVTDDCTIIKCSMLESNSETVLSPSNMPDLIQDVAKCAEMEEPDNEDSTPRFKSLHKWLKTARINGAHEEQSSDATRLSEAADVKKTKGIKSCNSQCNMDRKGAKSELPTSKKRKGTKKSVMTASSVTASAKLSAKTGKTADQAPNATETSMSIPHCKSEKPSNKSIVMWKAPEEAQCENVIMSVPNNSAFVNIAVSKLKKNKEKKRVAALKRKQEPVQFHSPKRVAFEMSKTQIKPFRKTDKAIACSPSPTVIAFDPRKKPRYGLLKGVKTKELHKCKASDFFGKH